MLQDTSSINDVNNQHIKRYFKNVKYESKLVSLFQDSTYCGVYGLFFSISFLDYGHLYSHLDMEEIA